MTRPDEHHADPRLARLHDVFDDDRSDLDHYEVLAEELGARRVLDIGCGTGSLAVRLAAQGLEVIGVDPAAASLDVARGKPGADRIHTANAHGWRPPQTYDFVRTGLDYVPARSRRAYVDHLMDHVVAPGGRLVIGAHNRPDDDPLPAELESWGHRVAGSSRRPHRRPGVSYAVLWIDRAASTAQ